MFKKIALAATALTAVSLAYVSFLYASSSIALVKRFPNLDPHEVRAVHDEMLKRVLRDEYAGIDLTDEKCDEIFLKIHEELFPK